MSEFNNYKNNSAITRQKMKNFDSFNGTEMKVYLKIPTKINRYEEVLAYELLELCTCSAVSGSKNHAVSPVTVMGSPTAVAVAIGDKIVSGRMSIEILNSGFMGQFQDIMSKSAIKRVEVVGEDGETTYSKEVSEINFFNEFPLFDIIMIGVKESDKNKKIEKEIRGCRFVQNGSGIGLNQLGVSETYQFLAKDMTDFKPLKGVEEEAYSSNTDIPEGELSLFG